MLAQRSNHFQKTAQTGQCLAKRIGKGQRKMIQLDTDGIKVH